MKKFRRALYGMTSAVLTLGFVSGGIASAQADGSPDIDFNYDAQRVVVEFEPISNESFNEVRHARGIDVETVTPSTGDKSAPKTTTTTTTKKNKGRTTVTVTETQKPTTTTTTEVLPPDWDGYVYDGSEGVENGTDMSDMEIDWNAPKAEQVLQLLKSQLGVPYVWGGNSWRTNGVGGGLDCSGLVQQAYKRVGINLPRVTYQQVKAGREVPLSEAKPGDLVFNAGPSHVQVITKINPDGTGQVIHAPQTGDVVRYAPLGSVPVATVVRVL